MNSVAGIVRYLIIIWDVLTQRIKCWGLGPLESVCASAKNKTIVITGPTSGIGRSAAVCLAKKGGNVILACRNVARGEALKQEIVDTMSNHNAEIEVWKLDVSDFSSVRDFVEKWKASGRPLHVLINNAGIFNIAGVRKTASNCEEHMATNFLGPFLLTLGLLPSIRAAGKEIGDARIVNVSSIMQTMISFNQQDPMLEKPGNYSPDIAYSQTKLALTTFTTELRRRLPFNSNVMVCSLHPGEVITDVARSLPSYIIWIYKAFLGAVLLYPPEGARPIVYCATSSKAPQIAAQTQGYFTSNCQPIPTGAEAQSKQFGAWLWSWASEMTSLPEDMNIIRMSEK